MRNSPTERRRRSLEPAPLHHDLTYGTRANRPWPLYCICPVPEVDTPRYWQHLGRIDARRATSGHPFFGGRRTRRGAPPMRRRPRATKSALAFFEDVVAAPLPHEIAGGLTGRLAYGRDSRVGRHAPSRACESPSTLCACRLMPGPSTRSHNTISRRTQPCSSDARTQAMARLSALLSTAVVASRLARSYGCLPLPPAGLPRACRCLVRARGFPGLLANKRTSRFRAGGAVERVRGCGWFACWRASAAHERIG
ncbi:hypothetical protein FKP32DRAFT_1137813 [Trametes sanguinea]|nr:hypothetical protein FKP32DRAFT_1137813 [Trametes sanguinea]